MTQPAGLLFTKDHEWVRIDGDVATVGITEYAQQALGDIVYVELPRVGATLQQFANVGVVESVKAVSDVQSPVGGEVLSVNAEIDADPALVNREPFGGGWFYTIRLADHGELANLLSAEDYDRIVAQA